MPVSTTTHFGAGTARFRDLLYVVGTDRAEPGATSSSTRFIGFDRGQLTHLGERPWACTAVCVVRKPSERFVAIGTSGQVFTWLTGVAMDESVGPEAGLDIRRASTLDGFAVACGANGRVFLRTDEGTWIPFHASGHDGAKAPDFEAIGGISRTDAYAVGKGGAVYHWDGGSWTSCGTPVTSTLTGVAMTTGGETVFVTGLDGTLLRGSKGVFERIQIQGLRDDLQDCVWFDGKLYVATLTGLFVLNDSSLVPVDVTAAEGTTYRHLAESEGVLWSIGAHDVFCLDGTRWSRVDP
jgi:hypothetical protein